MMNPTFRRLGKTGAMEVGAHSDAHFQLVGLNGRADEDCETATDFTFTRDHDFPSSSLVRGRPHHPSSGNAKSHARAIAAG